MIGGLSHLVNFKGTDTIAALVGGRTYYHCNMAGYSIPAAEHRFGLSHFYNSFACLHEIGLTDG